jgi:ADP-ribose pyrophosphatase YjhB (NUDIX family)
MDAVPHLIVKKNDKILLIKRSASSKTWSSHWHCVCGGIEDGESAREAIIREAAEEIGLKIEDVSLETTVFFITKDLDEPTEPYESVELFFVANLKEDQEPVNSEPLKQDALDWFDPHNLPEPMIPVVAFGIQAYLNNERYAEFRS